MTGSGKQRKIENVIYGTLWLLIFCVPFTDYLITEDATLIWRDCYRTWLALLPFFIVFVLNNFFALPLLFAKKRYWSYSGVIIFTIILVFSVYPLLVKKDEPRPRDFPIPREQMAPDPGQGIEKFSGRPPGEKATMPPPGDMDFKKLKRPHPLISPRTGDFTFTNMLIALLLVGFNLGVNLFFRSINDQEVLKELEKHNLQFELDYLKGQINPHFLMNMLNNIHALVDIDAEKAKETIIGFSKLMRYVLYDGSQKSIGLEKEIEFIRNYVGLMSIRYPQDVDIQLSLPKIVPDIQIPPMLFVSFIENSFKHGISYRNRSFVDISLSLDESKIYYIVRNSVWSSVEETPQGEKYGTGGIGLVNTKKRLDLIYGNTYSLITEKTETEYKVNLTIPLKC